MKSVAVVQPVAISACMVTLGPAALLAACAYISRVQVQYLTTGKVRFLRALGFLFDQFRLEAGYFVLIILTVNFMLSFTSVIIKDDCVGQTCMLSFIVVVYTTTLQVSNLVASQRATHYRS